MCQPLIQEDELPIRKVTVRGTYTKLLVQMDNETASAINLEQLFLVKLITVALLHLKLYSEHLICSPQPCNEDAKKMQYDNTQTHCYLQYC